MRLTPALLAAAALVSACTALKLPQPEGQSTFLLDAQPAAAAHAARLDLVLAVGQTRARPGFDTPAMAYTRRANEIEYFARNRWADAPAQMLAPLIVQAVEQAAGFRAVVRGRSPAAADLRLDTELVRLQQDFAVQPSRVELTLRAQLIDLRSRRVLAAREFDAVEPAPSDDPYGGVTAANRALARLLGELASFCAERAPQR
jgi:cholesterol transport system auxiliary component